MNGLAEEYAKLSTTAEKKAFWKAHPLRGEVVIAIPGIQPFKMYCDNDDTVVKELHWTRHRGWELTSLKLWKALLDQATMDGIVLDIGTYSGIYALIAASVSSIREVHAFDIQTRCIERTLRNAKANDLNIRVTNAACLDRTGEVEFHFYDEPEVMSSVASVLPKAINTQRSIVRSILMDAHLAERKFPVRLVKIDVEGAEAQTIRGFRQIIEADGPDFIIEINAVSQVRSLLKLFPPSFRCYSIDESTPRLRRMGRLSRPFRRARNYLFTQRSETAVQALLRHQQSSDWA